MISAMIAEYNMCVIILRIRLSKSDALKNNLKGGSSVVVAWNQIELESVHKCYC